MTLSIPLILQLVASVEERIEESNDKEEKCMWIVAATYAFFTYVIYLRGNEVFLLDLEGLNKNWKINNKIHFIITLLRKVKGENNDRRLIILCVNHTDSGVNIKSIVRRLDETKKDT